MRAYVRGSALCAGNNSLTSMPEHPRRPATAATVRAAAALAGSKHCTLKTAKRGESRKLPLWCRIFDAFNNRAVQEKGTEQSNAVSGYIGGGGGTDGADAGRQRSDPACPECRQGIDRMLFAWKIRYYSCPFSPRRVQRLALKLAYKGGGMTGLARARFITQLLVRK